jgi:hypothetical protein
MTPLLIALIVFLAVFTQSLTGFGSALVAMALLPGLMGMRSATPLVAVMSMTVEIVLLIRYHSSLNIRAVWRLVLASLFGIPLGILFLRRVDEGLVMTVLGIVIAGYALYALFDIRLPELKNPSWAYGFGFLAGMLGGAYNTSGPPVVIFANCRRWLPAEFKSNLQGFFLINSVLVVSGHAWSGNFTPLVLKTYAYAFPVVLLGMLLGIGLDRYLNPEIFRKLVLLLLCACYFRERVLSPVPGVERAGGGCGHGAHG